MRKSKSSGIMAAGLWFISSGAWATGYLATPYLTSIDIWADNGVTYFAGFTTSTNCAYSRLELRETGDYYGNVENGRRIYATILAAKITGLAFSLGYNDGDGPACRVASVHVQW